MTIENRRKPSNPLASADYRIEKHRADATLLLANGQFVYGHFFLGASARHHGRELVGELLNDANGFFPFERVDAGIAQIVIYDLAHVVMVTLAENEARRVPGYDVAKCHVVSLLLSNTRHLVGTVRVYLPAGHDRVSDWARDALPFRYVETSYATIVVNMQHVTEVTEVEPS